MGRPKRAADGGLINHELNRANSRMKIFEKDGDYQAFEKNLREPVKRTGTELMAWCLLPSHWHLVVRPQAHDLAADRVEEQLFVVRLC